MLSPRPWRYHDVL